MIFTNIHATDCLTSAERAELALRYDGPIPATAVDHIIAQRGLPEHVPTLEDLKSRLKFIRSELARETAKSGQLYRGLVEAVVEWDIAPAQDKQRRHNIVQSRSKQVARQSELVAQLISDESKCVEAIENMVAEARELLAAE